MPIFQEETAALGIAPMVGIISLSLSTVIERIERCRDRRIDLFQVSLPAWGALTDRERRTFFVETCGRLVTPAEHGELAERHPNLVATKNSGADTRLIIELQQRAPELRHFLTEGGFATGALLGSVGFLVSIASINPCLAREFFAAGVRRDAAALGDLGPHQVPPSISDCLGAGR